MSIANATNVTNIHGDVVPHDATNVPIIVETHV